MITFKRTSLLILIFLTLSFIFYQLWLVVRPLSVMGNDKKYVCLVNQYQVLKMERLVLEEKYALAKTKAKFVALNKTAQLPTSRALMPTYTALSFHSQVTTPIALSLEETKTFEQLEAYVSNNKPLQPQSLSKDEKVLLQLPPDEFTLQLLGVRDVSELTRFINDNHLQDAHVFHTYYLNKDWYVLVSGAYKNHTEALKAIEMLPAQIKDLKPWIRQLSSVQKAIQLYR